MSTALALLLCVLAALVRLTQLFRFGRQLARNARGSYRDFFKSDTPEQIVEDYVDSSSATNVPFLPLLFAVIAALIAATVFVAKST